MPSNSPREFTEVAECSTISDAAEARNIGDESNRVHTLSLQPTEDVL